MATYRHKVTMLTISFGKDLSKFEFKGQSHESCTQDQKLTRQYSRNLK
jgi:hypothetical protein